MIGRVLYGAAFCLGVPLLLVAWASVLDGRLVLPPAHHAAMGAALLALGVGVFAWACAILWTHGRGLPMNAFPPPRYVTRGPYRFVRHPIYVGFTLAALGVSLLVGSPAGAWIVSPLVALGCAALAIGFENHDLRRRFGDAARTPPLIHLAPATSDPPTLTDFASLCVLVFIPWLVMYEGLGHVGPDHAISTYLPFEHRWPVLQWTEPFYIAAYLAVLSPLLFRRRADLRRFAIAGLVGTFIGGFVFFLLPLRAEPRPFESHGVLGWLLDLERADGVGGRGAFPSFHVFWAILTAWACATRGPLVGVLGALFAGAIITSCATTGMHSLADLAGGVLLALVSLNAGPIWLRLSRAAEFVANSWREWRLRGGALRIINHGAYAGLAAAAGVLLISTFAGPRSLAAISLVAVTSLIAAGLWGQYFVGSPTLLRPFGYFGSVLGATIGVAIATLAGVPFWPLAGAIVIAAPWVQGLGRFRCLVQGCCHGAPTDAPWAIRYHHPSSRVCRISHLEGTPVHPTPLYSLAWCAVLGLFLLRLRFLDTPAPLVAGLYLILNGLARFVEESYRGEVQTPVKGGLRLYQWFAAASVAAGVTLSFLPSTTPWPAPNLGWPAIPAALAIGLLYWFAMGMDFPDSNRRFSRLA